MPFVESGYAVLLKTLFYIPSARTGRFGNPIGRVSDGSFPYFCPYRNRVPARHERKKIYFFEKGKRIAAGLKPLAMTKRLVILSAKRERIRNPLERERIATAVYTASQ